MPAWTIIACWETETEPVGIIAKPVPMLRDRCSAADTGAGFHSAGTELNTGRVRPARQGSHIRAADAELLAPGQGCTAVFSRILGQAIRHAPRSSRQVVQILGMYKRFTEVH